MTPEECADLILTLLDIDKKLLKKGVFEAVRNEISDVIEDAEHDQFLRMCPEITKASANAYEDAAKIAESLFPLLKDTQPNTPDTIAQAIRMRAKEMAR